jgi:orotate phosphoribosyltransferase
MTYHDSQIEVRKLLDGNDLVRYGHFRINEFTSKERHTSVYVNPRAIFRDYSVGLKAVHMLLDRITFDVRSQIDVVAGPATGGVIIARDISGLMDAVRDLKHKPIKTIFLTKDQEGLYELHESDREFVQGKNVLLVDDVRYTGDSLAICAMRIKDAGGVVVATGEIIDRGVKAIVPNPFVDAKNFWALQMELDMLYKPSECPMCLRKVPFTRF